MAKSSQDHPWKNGVWQYEKQMTNLWFVNGDQLQLKNFVALDFPEIIEPTYTSKLNFGDFGEAPKELKELTGEENFNLEITCISDKSKPPKKCILHSNGQKITAWSGMFICWETIHWLSEEHLETMKNERESYYAPLCPHIEAKSGQPGKMYWISGPPGAGKSTTSQLLARKKGLVYFEADCGLIWANPFTDPNAPNPSVAGMGQNPLKDVPEEIVQAVSKATKEMNELTQTNEWQKFAAALKPFATAMTKMIKEQRERLGGTWSIALAVPSRDLREHLRQELGPDLIFIVLNMDKECQIQRIKNRTNGTIPDKYLETFTKVYDVYEPAGQDEENAFNIDVSKDMTEDDVLKKAIEIIEKQ